MITPGLGQFYSDTAITPAIMDACGVNPCTDWDYLWTSNDCTAFGTCLGNVAACGLATCTAGQLTSAATQVVGTAVGNVAAAAGNAAGAAASSALSSLNLSGYIATGIAVLVVGLIVFGVVEVAK
jgi:hypothetical protein